MKYCPKCGTPTEQDSGVFCTKCGSRFEAEVQPETATVEITTSLDLKWKKISVIIAIAILVVAIVIFFVTGVIPNPFGAGETSGDEATVEEGKEVFFAGLGSLSGMTGRSQTGEPDEPATPKPQVSIEPATPEPTLEPTPEASETPDSGSGYQMSGSIVVMSNNSSMQSQIDNYVKRDLPNLDVELMQIDDPEGYVQRINLILASGESSPDVIDIGTPYAKKYIESGALLDLSNLEKEAQGLDMMPYALDYARDGNGIIRALPTSVSPGVMIYRRSYARNYLGTDDPTAMQNMFGNPQSFMDAGRIISQASGQKCRITTLSDLKQPILGSRAQGWVSGNTLAIDGSLYDSLDLVKTLSSEGLLADCDMWEPGWFDSFRNGYTDASGDEQEIFSYFMPKWGVQYVIKENCENAETGESTLGDWAVIPGPFAYFMGGQWLGVNANTKNADAAKLFVSYMTLDENYLESWARDNQDMTASNKVNFRLLNISSDPLLGGQSAYEVFIEASGKINGSIYSSYDETFDSLWNEQLVNYVRGLQTKEGAVETFKQNVSQQSQGIDVQ